MNASIRLAVLAVLSIVPLVPAQDARGEGSPAQPIDQRRQPSGGNAWFDSTDQDLGTYYGEGLASGVFSWKNPTGQQVVWRNLGGSCQCIRAVIKVADRTYELRPKQATPLVRFTEGADGRRDEEPVTQITIEPNEEGQVEVYLDMHQIKGPKLATLDIHTTDPKLPHIRLRWTAMGAQLFTLTPNDVNLNKMLWNETREFQVQVVSPLNKEWNITSMEDAGEMFDVTWEKGQLGQTTAWTIKGKYGPVGADTRGGGVLKFHTDVTGGHTFQVNVMAFVQGPLEVTPGGFLPLGMIRHGTTTQREIVFAPNDGSDLALTGYHLEKVQGADDCLRVTSKRDGDKLVVEVEVTENAPQGLLKGDLVLELNHPLVKEKRIVFNGFVR
jgi:hypothetical protein